ncbi:MAG: hypothetical protein ACR2LQ_06950 [Acidimicrobiales bacterium]
MATRSTAAVAAVALVLLAFSPATSVSAQQVPVVQLRVQEPARGALDPDLVGFNWRAGGEAVAPLRPGLVRSFAVRLARISPSPDVVDFTAADAELDAVEATGATPLAVLIERPPWDPGAGSPGYERVVEAVIRHYLVQRPAAGHLPVWFESGNEPEFPPTAHGQLPQDLAADVAAQVRALVRVESDTGLSATYGGPGALFADAVLAAMFVAAARGAGRVPDFVSWHTYSNAPMLGPDGPEDRSSPAALAAWEALHGTNPAASPVVLGAGIDVMRATIEALMLPGERPPALIITEWNLSPGGFDHRNDTHVGAAHTVAALIEMQAHGLDGATFFAAVDRHCANPDVNPSGATFCGDWGTASAVGERKPVWHAFELWQAMTGPTRALDGADPAAGLWALATDDPATSTMRVLAASFSVSLPTDRRLRIEVSSADGERSAQLRRIDAGHPDGAWEPTQALAAGSRVIEVDLPANSVVLVEVAAASPTPRSPDGAGDTTRLGEPATSRGLPATGASRWPASVGALALAAFVASRRLLHRSRRARG